MNTTTRDLPQNQPSLGDLLKLTASGTAIMLTTAGKPVAQIIPALEPSTHPSPRTPGLQPDAITYLSDDWDEPLPDEFWMQGEP